MSFLLFGFKLLFPIIILGISHYGIDWIKIKLQKKFDKDSIRIFVLDQFLHLLMIFLMIPIINPIDETSFIFWHKWIAAWLVELFPVLNKMNNDHWTVVVATIGLYLSIINGGTVVTKLLINKIKESPAKKQQQEEKQQEEKQQEEKQQNTNEPSLGEVAVTHEDGHQQQRKNTVVAHLQSQSERTYTGGEIIGNLERVLILTLILLKEYAVISFVLAAKSIARYNKIVEDPNFSDKFLIGTLTSVMIAIVAGIIFRWVIMI